MRRINAAGFTLIELLIVVAIIAILAAIAVPNFMEAQVRAKVSRAHADMRTIALGIQAYVVDNNTQPPVSQTSPYTYNTYSYPLFITELPNGKETLTESAAYVTSYLLTTPVAYLQRLRTLKDPFTKNKCTPGVLSESQAGYVCFMKMGACKDKKYYDEWFNLTSNNDGSSSTPVNSGILAYQFMCSNNFTLHGPKGPQKAANLLVFSIGPSRVTFGTSGVYQNLMLKIQTGSLGAKYLRYTMGDPVNMGFASHYDPSNGTNSVGMIARFD